MTLEVGDYVLSPLMAAERKTVADLRSSLASGRLHDQAAALCAHYPTPLLLLEFEADRAFALQVFIILFCLGTVTCSELLFAARSMPPAGMEQMPRMPGVPQPLSSAANCLGPTPPSFGAGGQ